ncbi:MAG TPA: acyl-CoA dehydrogenase family protein [Candidatus Dormibacteraeota bacterium]|nr:acyl-CoA dehydrogenase family protein [Candidatus Dormibacteraeota bacterium]
MVSFELSEEQRQIRDWVHEFAEREIRPVAAYYDETEEFPWPVVKKAAEVGLYSHEFLAQTFADPTGILPALVAEELCWGCAGIALAIQGTGLPVAAIFNQGTPEQIATWIPACYGTPSEPVLGAFCVSEPDAGSDVSSMKTRAVKRNGDWVLNGRKVFITNGGIAAVHVVVAAVDPELGVRGQASFVVPPGTPGLRQGKKEKKMGIRASHTAEVILEDVRVPSDCLLGGEERLEERLARARSGQRSRSAVALKTFEATRPVVGAQALGIARAAFEFALQYAQERRQFGRPLIENQAIAFKLADMATEIEAARGLIWRALWESRHGGRFEKAEGSMAKLKAGEVAVRVTEEAIQICGGYGYIRDFPVEKWHRDAKIYTIFEGTSEIQRLVISRALAAR